MPHNEPVVIQSDHEPLGTDLATEKQDKLSQIIQCNGNSYHWGRVFREEVDCIYSDLFIINIVQCLYALDFNSVDQFFTADSVSFFDEIPSNKRAKVSNRIILNFYILN